MSKKLKDLNPTKGNPRLDWTTDQQEAFKKSIREFGDLSGIVYNRKSKQLVGGNKRRAEFVEGDAAVTIVTELDKPDSVGTVAWGYVDVNGTRFNYREVDWPRKKELAANLAANQHGADFEWQLVSEYIQELGTGYDLSITGFSESDINGLIAADWTPADIDEGEIGSNHKDVKISLTEAQYKTFTKAKLKASDAKASDADALVAICKALLAK